MNTNHHNRIPALDFMRAAGVVAVAVGHFLQFVNFRTAASDLMGYLSMNLFFVLSGFLIGSLVFGEIKKTEKLNILHFYIRRNLKLLPSFYVVLLLYFFIPSFREDAAGGMAPFWRFATFTQNYFSTYGTFIQAWSLCVEEQFYLIFPFAALWLSRYKSKTVVTGFLFFISICVLLRFVVWTAFVADSADIYKDSADYIYFPTWARGDCLGVGCLAAYIRFFYADFWNNLIHNSKRNFTVFFFLIIAALFLQTHFISWYGATFTHFVASVAFVFFIFYGMNQQIGLNSAPSYLISLIAKLAYSIYLTHRMSFKIADNLVKFTNLNLPVLVYFLLTFAIVLVNGSLLYYLVEFNMTKLSKRFSEVKPFASA